MAPKAPKGKFSSWRKLITGKTAIGKLSCRLPHGCVSIVIGWVGYTRLPMSNTSIPPRRKNCASIRCRSVNPSETRVNTAVLTFIHNFSSQTMVPFHLCGLSWLFLTFFSCRLVVCSITLSRKKRYGKLERGTHKSFGRQVNFFTYFVFLVFLLLSNLGCLFSQCLASLLSCLFITHVVVLILFLVKFQEPSGRKLIPPLFNNFQSYQRFVEAFAIHVSDLPILYHFSISFIPLVVIGSSSSTEKDIVLAIFLDTFPRPVLVFNC
mmetsp:Transcript_91413/g.186075  ORF Transcript_91413/g.186075 Transcript_91413/m.186075 type:complete len:265 (+) Transcript_91413:2460-3254(+)